MEPKIRRLLDALPLEYELIRTQAPLHAVELAAQAHEAGIDLVVAAGGDGTAHEVMSGLVQAAGDDVAGTMGVLPIGSGSDFAHNIGLPRDLEACCRRLVEGRRKRVDLGKITLDGRDGGYFDNTLGIGFDAVVTKESQTVPYLRGIALYLPVILKTIFLSLRIPQLTIRWDGQELEMPALMVVVANGPREGGGFLVAPDAVPDDGMFDLCMVREISRPAMLAMIPHFMRGTHVEREAVRMARTKRVEFESEDPLVVHVDGEMLTTEGHRMICEVVPERLEVIV
jgi:YegS/Rv2252/BmrU family lipid kinase